MIDEQPTKYATAYRVVKPWLITMPDMGALKPYGKVVKITPKHIWLLNEDWITKYKKADYPYGYKTVDEHKRTLSLVFQPNPLEEFLSNGA